MFSLANNKWRTPGRMALSVRAKLPPAWWLLTCLAPAEYWSGPRGVERGLIFALFVLLLALFAWRRVGQLVGDRPGFNRAFETSLTIWR
jgi:hypothetical protein